MENKSNNQETDGEKMEVDESPKKYAWLWRIKINFISQRATEYFKHVQAYSSVK